MGIIVYAVTKNGKLLDIYGNYETAQHRVLKEIKDLKGSYEPFKDEVMKKWKEWLKARHNCEIDVGNAQIAIICKEII